MAFRPPLPPNRTCAINAYGSPVDSYPHRDRRANSWILDFSIEKSPRLAKKELGHSLPFSSLHPVSRAVSMFSVQIVSSVQPQRCLRSLVCLMTTLYPGGPSAPCLDFSITTGVPRVLSLGEIFFSYLHPSSYPPSLSMGLVTMRSSPLTCSTMRALTPAYFSIRMQVSLLPENNFPIMPSPITLRRLIIG